MDDISTFLGRLFHVSTDIDSEIRLFADDCVCYREIRDTDDSLKLQKDIDRLGCWARKWGMRFQSVKCNIMQIQYNLNGLNPDGSFTVDDSNSFFSPYKNPSNSSRKQIFRDFFFLFYHGIVCCVYSLESPYRGDSNAHIQHTIIV